MNIFQTNTCETCAFSVLKDVKRLGDQSRKYDYLIALAGNPNVGKSTLFNALTGLRQHTGNWPGKTVERKEGYFSYDGAVFKMVDLPGTYSLMTTSEDEEVARNFILFSRPDVTVIVADATRLERNLNLILQILSMTDKAVLAVNLMDEAEKNGIRIDERELSRQLGIPVVLTNARSQYGLNELVKVIKEVAEGKWPVKPYRIKDWPVNIRPYIFKIEKKLKQIIPGIPHPRWIALRLLSGDKTIEQAVREPEKYFHITPPGPDFRHQIQDFLKEIYAYRQEFLDRFYDEIAEHIYKKAAEITAKTVSKDKRQLHASIQQKLDRIMTHPVYGFLIMALLLGLVLWITIIGSNYPSQWLNELLLGEIYPRLKSAGYTHLPSWLAGMLIDGMYLTTAWVVSVMLPPMAIFFPLFTLLEDFGLLPRVAFNLDKVYKTAGAHGKQALTMTMGFGCNAAAVVSTRIIDSPRERLIAIITNNFSLCNGRWPTQILLATLFIAPLVPEEWSGTVAMLAVAGIAILGVLFSLISSWVLSRTLLKGQVSAFYLELPPYRIPQIWKTIYTSLIERTLVVLWRAVVFAAPVGLVIWLITHFQVGDTTLANYLIELLDKPATWIGLNGIIILAFIIGIPANEIIIPSVLMLIILYYGVDLAGVEKGVLVDPGDTHTIERLLRLSGWTLLTAVNFMLLSLMHNPCGTTIYTIYKETKSWKWTAVATFFPLLTGFLVLFILHLIFG